MAVCGWLGHSEMAYGQLRMDPSLAHAAIEKLAARLRRPLEETAQAILDIAVSEMFVEVEKLASRAGVDLRDFTLMPFGGGGPMLGAFLARELGMTRVMAPRRPGVVSALGGLVADLRGEFIRTVFAPLGDDALPALRAAQEALAGEGRAWLLEQGHDGPAGLSLVADMRYAGQSYEIEVPLDPAWIPEGKQDEVGRAFHAAHDRIYDFHDPECSIEIVNLRLSAIGAGPGLSMPEAREIACELSPARNVLVYTGGAVTEIALYRRDELSAGGRFAGPAVITQEDTTLAVPAGARARVDSHLNLHLSFGDTADD